MIYKNQCWQDCVSKPNLTDAQPHLSRRKTSAALCARIVLSLIVPILMWAAPVAATGKPKLLAVVTTIAQIGQPLGWIGQDCLQVQTLLGAGSDPHLYRPTRGDLSKLLRADTIVYNGANLEAQFEKPFGQLAARKQVIALATWVPKADRLAFSGKDGDPHFWMNPHLWASLISQVSHDIASNLNADCQKSMRARAEIFARQSNSLDMWAKQTFALIPASKRILITAHDAFGYFGQHYGFEVQGIQGLSTESQASLKRMNDLATLIADRAVPVAFVESSIDQRGVETLIQRAQAKGAKVVLGPSLYSDAMGARGTDEATYLGMMAHNSHSIAQGFGLTAALPEDLREVIDAY